MKCKGCTARHLNCHDSCEDYAEYRRGLEKISAIKQEERNYVSYKFYAMQLAKKRRKEEK